MSATKPQCPYCAGVLTKMPLRKTRCPSCGQPIHVKSSPGDRIKRLVTAAEAEAIEQRWKSGYVAQRDERYKQAFGVSAPRDGAQQRALGRQVAERDLRKLNAISTKAEIFAGKDGCRSCKALEGVWDIDRALKVMPLPNENCERYRRAPSVLCCAFWGLPR